MFTATDDRPIGTGLDDRPAMSRKDTVVARLTSLSAWELPKQSSAIAPPHVWTNSDMDPVKPEQQTWTMLSFMAYWCSDAINIGTWETASSIIAVGLPWTDALPIVVVGTTCVAIPMMLNGSIGSRLHIPFPIAVRSAFGVYLAYFCIVSRGVLAMFWLGVQSANGAQAAGVMVQAIWPSYANVENHLPASAAITSQGMISYFLFFCLQLPLLLIHPTKLRWLFIAKLIAAPVTALATLGWCVHRAGGAGDIFNTPATVHGSARAWLWLSCMTSVTGSWSTMACNIPDFSRYSKSTKAQFIQFPFVPLVFTVGSAMGVITTSASYVIYGEYIWNPIELISRWLSMGHGGRAAAFFAAASWLLAQIGSNITANSISAANDMTVLFPRYINIRRGCVVAAFVGCWAFVPWKIIASASSFLSFMGGYSVFLAPISGVLVADYWLVKNFKVDVPALYDPKGRYHYWHGINWRALVALVVAAAPNLGGLAHSISGVAISVGAQHLYTINWLYGFVTSLILYTVLNKLFPAQETIISQTVHGYDVFESETVLEAINGTEPESSRADDSVTKKGFSSVAAVEVGN